MNDVIMTPVSGSVNTHTFLKGIIKIWSDALVILIYWGPTSLHDFDDLSQVGCQARIFGLLGYNARVIILIN